MPTVASMLLGSAALLNDAGQQSYTNAAQLPYYNIAQNELNEAMEDANVAYSNRVSAALLVDAFDIDIGGATGPALPTDLIEIQQLWERSNGTTNEYIPMVRVDFIPKTSVQSTTLEIWAWVGQVIELIGATSARDVKIDYISSRLPVITNDTTNITLFNAVSFLTFRTAALCAQYIGENKSRADELNVDAGNALDRFLSISAKGRQAIATRRRPFRSAFKSR